MEEPEEQEGLDWASHTVRPGTIYVILNNRNAVKVIIITLKHLARRLSMTQIIDHVILKWYGKKGKWSFLTFIPKREANTTTPKRNVITITTITSTASVTLAVIGKWDKINEIKKVSGGILAKRARNILNWMGLIRWSIHHWDNLQLKSKMCIYSISNIVVSPSVWWLVSPLFNCFDFFSSQSSFTHEFTVKCWKIPASGRLIQESLQIIVIFQIGAKIHHSCLSFVCKHIYESLINSIIIRLWPQGHRPIRLRLWWTPSVISLYIMPFSFISFTFTYRMWLIFNLLLLSQALH